MFYSVASPDWKPGQPLSPAGALLFRTEAEAASFAPDAAVVAVAVRHDGSARAVRPRGCGASIVGTWSAPAVDNRLGGIMVFGSIPAPLVSPLVATRSGLGPVAASTEVYGWDSLTMALMA